MAERNFTPRLPRFCPNCKEGGETVMVIYNSKGIGACPYCQFSTDENLVELDGELKNDETTKTIKDAGIVRMFREKFPALWIAQPQKGAMLQASHGTDMHRHACEETGKVSNLCVEQIGNTDRYRCPVCRNVYPREPVRVFEMKDFAKGIASGSTSTTEGVAEVVKAKHKQNDGEFGMIDRRHICTRAVIFHAYISEEVEKLFRIKEVEVRAHFQQYQYETGEPLTTLTKHGKIWTGICDLKHTTVKEIHYRYYINDEQSPNTKLKEHGLPRKGELHVAAAVTTFYDGNIHFQQAQNENVSEHSHGNCTTGSVEKNIVTGWKAMLPNWMDEIQGKNSLEALLQWVDGTERSECGEIHSDAKTKIDKARKKRIKSDMTQHHTLMKAQKTIDAQRLFLSMVGLIYRAERFLDKSKKVPLRLDKLVGETIEKIRSEIANWKGWLDESLNSHKSSLLYKLRRAIEASEANENWPYLIPIIHYLGGRSYEIAGLTEPGLMTLSMSFCKPGRKFKNEKDWTDLLEPFMADDPLLSYTVMAMMQDDRFQKFLGQYVAGKYGGIRLDAVLQRSTSILKTQDVKNKAEIFRSIQKCLEDKKTQSLRALGIRRDAIPRLSEQLLSCFPHKIERDMCFDWEKVKTVLDVYMSLMSMYQAASDQPDQPCRELETSLETLWDFVEHIAPYRSSIQYYWDFLKTTSGTQSPRNEGSKSDYGSKQGDGQVQDYYTLKLWVNLSLLTPEQHCTDELWHSAWKERVSKLFHKMDPEVITKSLNGLERTAHQRYLEACAEYILSNQRWKKHKCLVSKDVLDKLCPVINHAIVRDWRVRADEKPETTTLNMFSRHKQFLNTLEFHKAHKLSPQSEEILETITAAAKSMMDSICQEECKVAVIQLLRCEPDTFREVAQVVSPNPELETAFNYTLEAKGKELDEYMTFKKEISSKHGELSTSLLHLDVNLTFSALYDSIDTDGHGRETVKNYNLLRTFNPFQAYLKSELEVQRSRNALATAVRNAHSSANLIIESIRTGSILVTKLKEFCARHYQNNAEDLIAQLSFVDIELPRTDIVKKCLTLELQSEKAKALLNMNKLLGLEGEITLISRVAIADSSTLTVGKVDDDFLEICKRLCRMNETTEMKDYEKESLTAFKNCKDLVEWIATNVEENAITKYVHIAKDLYPLTEDRAAKASELLNVLTGYAPLLYHYKRYNKDLISLYRCCEKLWANVKVNSRLPQLLIRCNKDSNILKAVGSDICKSVMEADAINSSGVYTISSDKKICKTVNDVLRLECPMSKTSDEKDEESKSLSYDDLGDLQSRLALVGDAEANHDTIQRFQKLKDGMQRLAEAYLEILQEGCVNFDSMVIVVYCNPEGQYQGQDRTGTGQDHVVEVQLESVDEPLYGEKSESKTNLQHCMELHKYLKECVENWRKLINKERSTYSELNFYTIAQLVTLRKEMGQFAQTECASSLKQALPLLEMIHPAQSEQLLRIIRRCEEFTSGSPDEADDSLDLSEVQKENIRTLQDENDAEEDDDIIAAVRHVGDVDMLTSGEDVYLEFFKRRRELREQNTAEISDVIQASVSETKTEQTLQSRLTKLWETLVNHTSKSVIGLLSLRHLALVLQELKEMSKPPTTPRHLPDWLNRGKSALVGVPSNETYKFVLSLYAVDEDFAFPTRNEVLVCTETTSSAEVELFMTRALSDEISCYCMINCELLDYDVCQMIDTKLKASERVPYGLVFIYAEKMKKCCIKAYLDKLYMKTPVPSFSKEQLKENICKKIICTADDIATCATIDRHFVRLACSKHAGVGKSLVCKNFSKKLKAANPEVQQITVSIHKQVKFDSIVQRLSEALINDDLIDASPQAAIHIDIAPEVKTGVDELLFNLLILKSLPHSDGRVWQVKANHSYLIEYTKDSLVPEMVDLLPATNCISPLEAMERDEQRPNGTFKGFDGDVIADNSWQLVLNTLIWQAGSEAQQTPDITSTVGDRKNHLELLIRNCGSENPTWSELANFVKFLGFQLLNIQRFLHHNQSLQAMPTAKSFLVRFMVNMAKDFATQSATLSEESPSVAQVTKEQSKQSRPTSAWEQQNYPYLFFKDDAKSFTTIGVYPVRQRGGRDGTINLCGSQRNSTRYTITRELFDGLALRGMLPPLNTQDFQDHDPDPKKPHADEEARKENCWKLREVMIEHSLYKSQKADAKSQQSLYNLDDLDPNYVLTQDNAKKMLAIYCRFMTGIPVVIMGETGCGKTKLIEFMSELQLPRQMKEFVPVKVFKIHGGTTNDDIVKAVKDAEQLAKTNKAVVEKFVKQHQLPQVPTIYTILFFDEVNTTPDIGLIKEIMCDHRMNGDPLPTALDLKFIAACNPYKRMTDDMLLKLKSAGLGYINEQDKEKLAGEIPLRELVYRVQPLPISLKSLAWEFGKIPVDDDMKKNVELKYIKGIVSRMKMTNSGEELQFHPMEKEISELIAKAQLFMRNHQDECSFVSLRDVERLLVVSNWFYRQEPHLIDDIERMDDSKTMPTRSLWSLLLGIGVCYISRLQTEARKDFAEFIEPQIETIVGDSTMSGALLKQIDMCQSVFAKHVICPSSTTRNVTDEAKAVAADDISLSLHWSLEGSVSASLLSFDSTTPCPPSGNLHPPESSEQQTIAVNRALKENLFMMITCIETRIPLFVIGRPGTSKSLANRLVSKAMQGKKSESKLFRELKFMVQEAFQCSRHTTPGQIQHAFEQCAVYQKDRSETDSFVSVVLLDEIGLAEDSQSNPLKILHPLLETSCYGEQKSDKKCGFIGISNWALDPAKMNRGLYLQVSPPDVDELIFFATQILEPLGPDVVKHVPALTKGYFAVCKELKPPSRTETEFYGLRDFYSLVKMIAHLTKSTGEITRNCLEHCIRRNFNGFPPDHTKADPVLLFLQYFGTISTESEEASKYPTDCATLLKSSLFEHHTKGYDSRYLMILSENISVLNIILDLFEDEEDSKESETKPQQSDEKRCSAPEVIFGSAFKDDVSYTQVCRNVYKIRMSMAKGQTAIILNIDDLHESLYDLLNQSFYTWGKKSFVDIGIGIHRVPAHVDEKFRLVLIAAKDEVYSKFPIPLINRFEKHYVSAATFLDSNHSKLKQELDVWMNKLVEPSASASSQYFEDSELEMATSFVGHSSEMSALLIQKATKTLYGNVPYKQLMDKVLKNSKELLLQSATAECVLRLDRAQLKAEALHLQHVYAAEQEHDDLLAHLKKELVVSNKEFLLMQVTTFAELMSEEDVQRLQEALSGPSKSFQVKNIFLTKFPQEALFRNEISDLCQGNISPSQRILIIQCESANNHTALLDSVRYILQREHGGNSTHMVLLLSLARGQSFTSYQAGAWRCVHIDDPRFHTFTLPRLHVCLKMMPYQLIEHELTQESLTTSHKEESNKPAEAPPDPKENVFPSLLSFIKHCLPQVLPIIRCHQHRDYNRLQTIKDLLVPKSKFTCLFLKHIRSLLEKQEYDKSEPHWTRVQAGDARKMKKAETMRVALSDTLEKEYRPAIAAVTAFIDPHRNLRLLEHGDQDTINLWLKMFEIAEEIGLAFEQGLPHWFKMYHVGDESKMSFQTEFPFSWIVKDAMDKVMINLSMPGGDQLDLDQLAKSFHKDTVGKLLTDVNFSKNAKLFESYLNDFIYLSHPFQPVEHEHQIINQVLTQYLAATFRDDYGVPHIHVVFEQHRSQLKNLAEIFQLRSSVAADVQGKVDPGSKNVDMMALIVLVNLLTETDHDELLKAPEDWVDQVDRCKDLFDRMFGDAEKDVQENEKHSMKWPKLKLKQLYVKCVVSPTKPDPKRGRKPQHIQAVLKGVADGNFHKREEFLQVVATLKKVLQHFFKRIHGSPAKEEEFKEISITMNKFFMEFVCSDLVLSPKLCPDREVLEWLSNFATFQKHQRLDLRTCGDISEQEEDDLLVNKTLLKRYFKCLELPEMREHINTTISGLSARCSSSQKQLRTLKTIIQCYQDSGKEPTRNTPPPVLADTATQYQRAHEDLQTLSLKAMQELAALQTLITSSTEKIYQVTDSDKTLLTSVGQFLSATHAAGDTQPGYLALRTLLRIYGESFVMDFINCCSVPVIPREAQIQFIQFSVPDIFEVFGGEEYQNTKNQVSLYLSKHGLATPSTQQQGMDTRHALQAIFTILTREPNRSESLSLRMCETLLDKMHREPGHVRRLIRALITKGTWPNELNMAEFKGVNLSMLALHTFTSLCIGNTSIETSPFMEIMTQPQQAAKRLFPGMPDGPLDNLVKQCGLSPKSNCEMDHLCVYVCPSGHPYINGQFGAPESVSRCPFCKVTTDDNPDHPLAYSNILGKAQIKEKSSKCGHTIGRAKNISDTVHGVRQLNPLSCAVIRCLTHLSMLMSYIMDPSKFQTEGLFQPRIADSKVVPLLTDHIWTNLQLMGKCCGESIDNCILLIHKILDDLSQAKGGGAAELKSAVEREIWEKSFDDNYIKKTFETKAELIDQMREKMKTQVGIQCSERLNDLISSSEPVDVTNLLMSPMLWEYERPPTLWSMLGKLDPTKQDYEALRALVDNCDVLIALKHLPDIHQLIKHISDGFHGRLSRKDAKINIKAFMVKEAEILKLPTQKAKEMVESYVSAWNICCSSAHLGLADVTAISEDPPVSEFLLDKYNMLTSRPLNLIRCLVETHNKVAAMVPIPEDITQNPNSCKELQLSEVTTSQLVQVTSRDDLFHLLYCQLQLCGDVESSSLTCPIENVTAFDLIGKRKQIALRIDDLPFYKFKEDFELWKQIELLKHKQVKISERLQLAIMASVNLSNKSLNKDIKELENVINHLSAMPRHDPNMRFCDMTATLCMGSPRYLREDITYVIEGVKVKHVLHIWLMLKYAQADVFMDHQLKNPFDDVHMSYMSPSNLPADASKTIHNLFQPKHFTTKEFLFHLFEFITLRLNKGIASYDVNKELPSKPLHETLKRFVTGRNPGDLKMIERMPKLPDDIEVCHAVKVWTLVWRRFTDQLRG